MSATLERKCNMQITLELPDDVAKVYQSFRSNPKAKGLKWVVLSSEEYEDMMDQMARSERVG